jgi:hypothetical protein
MLGFSLVGVAGGGGVAGGFTAVRRFGGTAALPNVVKNASLGVESRRSPATCVNF